MTNTTQTETMANVVDIRRPYDFSRIDNANARGCGWSVYVPTRPTERQYRMALTICELRLLTVYERARWVADHPDYRDYLEAFRRVCEFEAENSVGPEDWGGDAA